MPIGMPQELQKKKTRTLEAFNRNKNQVQIIEAGSKVNALRLDNIGDQFNTQYVFVGGGDEYERLKILKQLTLHLFYH